MPRSVLRFRLEAVLLPDRFTRTDSPRIYLFPTETFPMKDVLPLPLCEVLALPLEEWHDLCHRNVNRVIADFVAAHSGTLLTTLTPVPQIAVISLY